MKFHEDDSIIGIQKRSIQTNNRTLTFNECHPKCGCKKDLCQNFLLDRENRHRWKTMIKRVRKISSLRGQ